MYRPWLALNTKKMSMKNMSMKNMSMSEIVGVWLAYTHSLPAMQSCIVPLVLVFLIAANTDKVFVFDRTILANHHFAFRWWAMTACTQL